VKFALHDPIFDLQGVRHTYSGPQPVEALRGIDLRIEAGEYVAIIGANGSGKSTLARHLNALLLPSAGQVRVAGYPTQDAGQHSAIRRAVQMVFQQPDLQIVATTVEEDAAFGLENFGVPEDALEGRVRQALETVELWGQRTRPPHMLSSGQKQRLAIAGALAVQPQALILDEATAMLDPAGRAAVLAVLDFLHQQGITLVAITHEMDEAALAGRVVVLDHGQVAMDGMPHQIFGQPAELRRLGLDLPPLADLALRLGLPVCRTEAELRETLGRPAGNNGLKGPQVTAPVTLAPTDLAIEVQELYHTYLRGTPLAALALRGVDLQVGRGRVAGLIGQTGSGKSTLMQHLNGLMRPQAGRVVVNGLDWTDPKLDVRTARQQVGLLFQQPEDQLFERYVGDDVAFGPRQMKLEPAEVRQRVQTAMEAVGLPFEVFKDRLAQSLSGGEQRRAALAGVLALQPQVLAADEPTAGLDPRGRKQIVEIFRRINQSGVTLLVGSHRMEDILVLCDQVTALRDGQVAVAGPTRMVLGHPQALAQHGLPVLPLAGLAARLRVAGWDIPTDALTVSELADALAAQRV